MEHTEILQTATDYIKSLPKEITSKDFTIDLYIKKPNIFYKAIDVYLRINGQEAIDITSTLKANQPPSFNLRAAKDLFGVLSHFYFITYNQVFNFPYFKITWRKVNGILQEATEEGSSSPDPKDSDMMRIRK